MSVEKRSSSTLNTSCQLLNHISNILKNPTNDLSGTDSLEAESKDSADRSISENRLTDQTFREFEWRWRFRRLLIVENCTKEIPVDKLFFRTNITSLEFSGTTTFTNLKTLLQYCSNLKSITFTHVLLSNFTKNSRQFLIELNSLLELKLNGSGKLSRDESDLVDFLHRRTLLRSLKSISFEEKGPPSPAASPTPTPLGNQKSKLLAFNSKVTLQNRKNNNNDVRECLLSNFILKHCASLKILQVRRRGMALFDHSFDDKRISKLQLETFSCDVDAGGFERILALQKRLSVLQCYYGASLSIKKTLQIYGALRTCSKTLEEILINKQGNNTVRTRAALLSPSRSSGNGTAAGPSTEVTEVSSSEVNRKITNDCRVYGRCKILEKLNIDISSSCLYPTQPTQQEMGKLLGFKNLKLLPSSLKSLILRFDSVDDDQMEAFAKQFSELTGLKYLIMHGQPESPYIVKLDWIATLLDLPQIIIFEFHFCNFVGLDRIVTFRRARSNLNLSKFEVTKDCCIYWKSAI